MGTLSAASAPMPYRSPVPPPSLGGKHPEVRTYSGDSTILGGVQAAGRGLRTDWVYG